jgi:hypothetical protein
MLLIDMLNQDDVPVTAQVDVGKELVEVRVEQRVVAIADRTLLRSWLLRPRGRFTTDKMVVRVVPAGLSLTIAGYVSNWVLGQADLWQLYNLLDEPTPGRRHLRRDEQ